MARATRTPTRTTARAAALTSSGSGAATNVAALSRYHGLTNVPMSRLLTFEDGSDEVLVQCCLRTSQYAPQGWCGPAERAIRLDRQMRL